MRVLKNIERQNTKPQLQIAPVGLEVSHLDCSAKVLEIQS